MPEEQTVRIEKERPESRPESRPDSRPESRPEALEEEIINFLQNGPLSKGELSQGL